MTAIISTVVLQVNARILQAPALKYSSDFGTPSEGSWNLRNGVRFNVCATMDSYAVVSFVGERDVGHSGPDGFPVSSCSCTQEVMTSPKRDAHWFKGLKVSCLRLLFNSHNPLELYRM